MAKQFGVVNLRGSIGDVQFSQTETGFKAGRKSRIDASKIATDPAFARTRENNTEFGAAGKGVKQVRAAFRLELQTAKDNKLSSRMVKEMMKVIKADITSPRGMRNVTNGEPGLLQGFEFNRNAEMGTTIYAQYDPTIERASGKLNVAIPSFIPKLRIITPDGTTHFKIISAGSAIDFVNESFTTDSSDSGLLPWDNTPTNPILLQNQLPASSTLHLFLVLGIQFFQMVNGTAYPLQSGSHNALSLVKVEKG